jgi:hypothetical protein
VGGVIVSLALLLVFRNLGVVARFAISVSGGVAWGIVFGAAYAKGNRYRS